MTLKNFINKMKEYNVEVCDLYFLIERIFNIKKEDIILKSDIELDEVLVDNIILDITKEKPIPYITKEVVFYNTIIFLNENCLIPRVETEELVDIIVKDNLSNEEKSLKILDLCSGSGCIGISLVKNLKNSSVTLVDIQQECLDISKKSANFNKVKNVEFLKSDFLSDISQSYDIVVCNPPYIKEDTKTITKFENPLCLFSGKDGLDSFKKIFSELDRCTNKKAKVYFECEASNMDNLIALYNNTIQDIFAYKILKDMSGKQRFLFLEKI